MKKILQHLKNFRDACDGIAATEFALTMPMMIMLFMAGTEMSRFIIVQQKTDKVAYTITDVVTQQTSVTISQLNQIMSAATQLMLPYTFGTSGVVIVSSVYKNGVNPPTVRWQYTGGGTLSRTSKIGAVNANATLPGGLTLNDKDNVLIAEVYYRYTPFLPTNLLAAQDVYKSAIYKPRLGALTTTPN